MDDKLSDEVQAWFERAEEDRKSARALLRSEPSVTGAICFHSQQLAEKALKAYLTANRRQVEKTHDLTRLITLCMDIDPEFASFRFTADELSPYAVRTRYPDDYRPVTLDDTKLALKKAERIMKFVKTKLDPTTLT
jgi:HEPN domain-containing protein